MDLKLQDLIDIQIFQMLQDKLNNLYSFPSAIIDLEGNVLSATAWQDICTKFHRINPVSEKECISSDLYIKEHLHEANPAVIYKCPHGLIDTATPIIIDGKHMANFFTGQFFLDKPEEEFFSRQAEKYGFDKETYLGAVAKVPVWTEEQLKHYLSIIKTFVEILVQIGNKRLLEEKNKDILEQKENQYETLIQSALDGFWEVDLNGNILKVNQAICKSLGYSPSELIGRNVSDIEVLEDQEEVRKHIGSLVHRIYDRFESRHRCKNGNILDVEVSLQYKPYEGGKVYAFFRDISFRKKSETAIMESEERYRLLAEATFEGIGISGDGLILDCNENLARMFGFEKSEIIGIPLMKVVAPGYEKTVADSFISGMESVKEYEGLRKDGSRFPVEVRGRDMILEGKKVRLAALRDLTEQKKTEEILRRNEERFKQVADSSGIWVWEVDERGMYTYASSTVASILGYSPDEVVGKKHFYDFFTPGMKEELRKGAFEAFSRKESIRELLNPNIHRDGRMIILETTGSPILDENGQLKGYIGADKDVTDREMTKKALSESEMRFRSMSDYSLTGIYIVDGGTFLYLNSALADIFGYRREELEGKEIRMVIYPDDWPMVQNNVRRRMEGEVQSMKYEFRGLKKDGSVNRILVMGARVRMNDKDVIIGNILDITENKKTEAELISAKEKAEQNDRLKTAFLANMSHEVRTPMNAIMGFTDLLMDAEGDDKLRFADIIRKNSRQLLTLIEDIMQLSRMQSEKLPVNLKQFQPSVMVQDIMHLYDLPEMKYGNELTLEIPDAYRNVMILSDEEKIKQILINMLSNALKYTVKGQVHFGFSMNKGSIEFFVRDTGIGIPEHEQKKIFENFYRGEQAIESAIRGTGLGLNISKELVGLLGGEIGLESRPGEGSRFWFTIPAEAFESLPSDIAEETVHELHHSGSTVLVAEDELDNFLYIKLLLQDKVSRVDHAMNGRKAVELAAENHYSLIIMDLKMPVMDGFEATEIIARAHPQIPVIALTAYTQPEEKARALRAGCRDYLEKPVRKHEFLKVLSSYLTLQ